MLVPKFLSSVGRWLSYQSMRKYVHRPLLIGLFLSSILLASCTGLFGGGSGAPPTPTSSQLPLAKLHWCSKPSMVFRDEGAAPTPAATAAPTATTTPGVTGTPTPPGSPTAAPKPGPGTPATLTDWTEVKTNLGFTVYLPATLPRGSCLVSAQATVHDPIFGGSFTIGYLLPDHSSITLSEAPLSSQNTAFQCSVSGNPGPQPATTPKAGTPQPSPTPTQAPIQLCSGARENTNIVLSARRSADYLQQFFNALQPDIPWIPAL